MFGTVASERKPDVEKNSKLRSDTAFELYQVENVDHQEYQEKSSKEVKVVKPPNQITPKQRVGVTERLKKLSNFCNVLLIDSFHEPEPRSDYTLEMTSHRTVEKTPSCVDIVTFGDVLS